MSMTIQERADQYNMPVGSKKKAKYRFTSQGWSSMMTYVKWAIERATKEAKATPKLQLIKELRFATLECGTCRSTGRLGGAAMTTSSCKKCGHSDLYGSTATPVYCRNCAINGLMCQYCGDELDEEGFL